MIYICIVMTASDIILQFATSEGGSFRKNELMSHMEGGPFSFAYIDLALNRMVKAGKLLREGRGLYRVKDDRREFLPSLSSLSIEIASIFKSELPFTKYCLYEGEWINPFMHHLAGNLLHYLEVERDAMDSVFDRLSAKGYTVFLRPDREFMYRYVDIHNPKAIILKPLVSESPLVQISEIPCPTLEKLLVDMSKDPDFGYLQGAEYLRILANVKRAYKINEQRLLRYASRRSAREEMLNALQSSDYDLD